MSQMTVTGFDFNNHHIRCFGTDRAPWFVAKDVCNALEILWRGSDTLANIPEDWRGVRKLRTPRHNSDGTNGFQMQDFIVINEAAVFKLAFRSNKPEADAFTNWVASEVLPAIRQHGAYVSRCRQRYTELGKPEDWMEEREEGIAQRHNLTDAIRDHQANNYADCTNAIYRPVLGAPASQLKIRLQIPQKANVRDNLGTVDLMKVKFAEMMATTKIDNENLQGNDQCKAACNLSGRVVAEAMRQVQHTPIAPPGS